MKIVIIIIINCHEMHINIKAGRNESDIQGNTIWIMTIIITQQWCGIVPAHWPFLHPLCQM